MYYLVPSTHRVLAIDMVSFLHTSRIYIHKSIYPSIHLSVSFFVSLSILYTHMYFMVVFR